MLSDHKWSKYLKLKHSSDNNSSRKSHEGNQIIFEANRSKTQHIKIGKRHLKSVLRGIFIALNASMRKKKRIKSNHHGLDIKKLE